LLAILHLSNFIKTNYSSYHPYAKLALLHHLCTFSLHIVNSISIVGYQQLLTLLPINSCTCRGAIAQLLTTLLHMWQNFDNFNLGTLAIKTNIMESSPLPSSFSRCLTIFPFTLSFVHILFYVFSTKCTIFSSH
jgi:hypothetical protein